MQWAMNILENSLHFCQDHLYLNCSSERQRPYGVAAAAAAAAADAADAAAAAAAAAAAVLS